MKPDTVGRPDGSDAARPPNQVTDHATGHATGLATGLCAVGLLLTAAGERPVGALRPGDRVITRDAGMVTLRALTRRRLHTPLVRIRAGSLGHRRPGRDALLPACQPILLRDWRAHALFGRAQILVAAARLVDGEFVTHEGTGALDLCQLDFGAPHILYLDGLEVASHAAGALVP
ncbi:Hint domain-containing protein [Roseovarius ramblicola]|uniref:Hint domain-containing protein n=1 Tax=Roseovarius ramblicola TaxID=2022336 RepID=A0ABV5HYS3_9RHOB